jgi:hypothetical protein
MSAPEAHVQQIGLQLGLPLLMMSRTTFHARSRWPIVYVDSSGGGFALARSVASSNPTDPTADDGHCYMCARC